MDGEGFQRWVTPKVVAGVAIGVLSLAVALSSLSGRSDKKKKKKVVSSSVKKNSKKKTTNETENENSNDMRGYKLNSKGQKTTYFNRELSEEEKRLLGDFTPKKIDPMSINSTLSSPSPEPLSSQSSPCGGSAWNQAGTWEEKNVTKWTRETLKRMLCEIAHTSPIDGTEVSISSVATIEGDATVSMIRGKKKYLYDLNTVAQWKLTSGDISVTGDLAIEEISADATHEFIVKGINISASDGKKAQSLLKLHVQSESSSLQKLVNEALQRLYDDMSTKY